MISIFVITKIFFLIGMGMSTPPACFLSCTNVISKWCDRDHSDFRCICDNSPSLVGCLVDVCPYGDFLNARDHFWGTCLERLSDRPVSNYFESDTGAYSSGEKSDESNIQDKIPDENEAKNSYLDDADYEDDYRYVNGDQDNYRDKLGFDYGFDYDYSNGDSSEGGHLDASEEGQKTDESYEQNQATTF